MLSYYVCISIRPVPHTLYPSDQRDICVFTRDPSAQYEELLEKKGVKNIAKVWFYLSDNPFTLQVIGVTKLRQHFKQYESKRKLAQSYDIYLADESILPMLPHLLGKAFMSTKKSVINVVHVMHVVVMMRCIYSYTGSRYLLICRRLIYLRRSLIALVQHLWQ